MSVNSESQGIWAWDIVKYVVGLSLILFVGLYLVYGFTEEGTRQSIRWSARISFVLFNLAFATSALHLFLKRSFTWWLRMNRKFIGISFALLHLIHLVFLMVLQFCYHPVFDLAAGTSLIGGGIAYFFVLTMLLTSFDNIKKNISPYSWKLIHTVGGYWIWTIFLTTYLKRAYSEPAHWILVGILSMVFLLRMITLFKNRSKGILKASSIFVVVVFATATFSCKAQKFLKGQTLIKNGIVVDGSGANEPFKSDILISNGKIIWIGQSMDFQLNVDTIIDVHGLMVSPGFIDIHAHGDPLATPDFLNFLSMGVSTIALGMDGSSVRSSDMLSWMNKIDSMNLGVNILPFIGHGTIRNESGIGLSKQPDGNQINKMVLLARNALELGCWGLSMGLEYHPGFYASTEELEALAKIVGSFDGLVTSHIRNEDNDEVEQSLEEMMALAKYCNVNISHLKVVFGKGEKRAKEILEKLKDGGEKYEVTADLYPYTASYTGIGIVFPDWAKVPKRYEQIKNERGDELLNYLKNKVNQRNGPDATLFGNGPYKGKTLKNLEEEYNLPFERVLKDIIGPYGTSAAFFVMDEALQNTLMSSDKVMIGSDGSPTMYHPRGYGTFAKVIEELVLRDSILSIENAIYKMSGMPAKTLGLESRGTIEIGNVADIVVFDPDNIRSNATFEAPHQNADGIEMVLMNGEVVVAKGELIRREGNILKREKLPKQ